jgi:hypothetical protein
MTREELKYAPVLKHYGMTALGERDGKTPQFLDLRTIGRGIHSFTRWLSLLFWTKVIGKHYTGGYMACRMRQTLADKGKFSFLEVTRIRIFQAVANKRKADLYFAK